MILQKSLLTKTKFTLLFCNLIACALWAESNQHASSLQTTISEPIIIFKAGKVITMEQALPEASAIAVSDGKILAVGSEKDLEVWQQKYDYVVDDSFIDKILMPGFIDPHVHPALPAVVTQFPFLAPEPWSLPTGDFPAATTADQYKRLLSQQVDAYFRGNLDIQIPFISWGYHPLWHGDVYREELNQLFPNKPVMLWHRSFHELIANDAALSLLGITEAMVEDHPEIDWQKGRFFENGAHVIVQKMPFLFAPQRYLKGLQNFFSMAHQGGVTSIMDMGLGLFATPLEEATALKQVAASGNFPSRIVLTPIITYFLTRGISPQEALEQVESWSAINSDQVMFDDHFKIMMDGAIFSGAAQYQYPGYIDGHQGQWMAPLKTTFEYAKTFWNAGYQIHAHTNGDASAAALIDIVRRLQQQNSRIGHRTTLEHFAYANEDQIAQMSEMGMLVSANPYYGYILADKYADSWLGSDRARNMVPLGSVARNRIKFGLHSDNPMAPFSPLTLAWSAVNRTTINGNQNFKTQSISVHQALKAVTIDAAWLMKWEDRVGSIRAGKKADFVVLEEDPYAIDPMRLKDIGIWGTVFEGKKFPIRR